ncbi:MAG: transglycosylase domain-containing protein [Bacteroidales bacterium]|jgi:penicillin-binding protein 1A|nr:transglycosylase domain-containing protein [Bacteroidales bacterium]
MAKKEDRFKKYKIWFWGIFAFPFVLIITIFILISLQVFGPMPGFEELENPDNNLAAEVYSADGVMLGKFFLQNRTWADYNEISPHVVDALIATEDIRFHRHSGIDFRSLVRVVIKSILLGQETGGGSTISQQLAKNLYRTRAMMEDGSVNSYSIGLGLAKFKEWATAVRLERNYTKEEIIAMYLNQYDFLYNAVGISSASSVYFNTTPDSLSIDQAAIIVGMLKNPIRYNPRRNPEAMLERRNIVLSQMGKYAYLEQEVVDSLKQLPIEIDFREAAHDAGLATYLREYVRTTMIAYEPEESMFLLNSQYLDAKEEWESNPLYGWCRKNKKPDGSNYNLYSDGLKIYTTIDSRMQQFAEESVTEHLAMDLQPAFYETAKRFRNPPFSNDLSKAEIESLMEIAVRRTERYRNMSGQVSEDSIWRAFRTPVPMTVFSWKGDVDTVMTPYDSVLYYKYFVRSSMMAMDPHTGHVKAYVGGPDFRHFKYDGVNQQRKQVGSTIKPFLYTLAMQEGYSPCYEVENIPREFYDPVKDTVWSPRSSGPREYHGKMVTLKWGLANSENYISSWLMKQFSPQAVADLMARMGISRRYIEAVNSIFLGTSVLTLNEMVGAFGTYANKGVFTEPIVVSKIEDRNGNILALFAPHIDEVMSEEEAYLMVSLLRGVVDEGTGIRLRWRYELGGEIGGKTGTTQNHSNGWFMGITPNLVAGVWTGWEDQAIHFEDMTLGQGANMALPVMGLFLQKLYGDPELGIMEADEFDEPPGFDVELDCDEVKSQGRSRDIYDLEEF